MVDTFALLTQGKILDAVIGVYTNAFMPYGEFFYMFTLFIGLTLVYMKTENFGTVGVIGFMIAGAVLAFIPVQFHNMAYSILYVSLGIIIYYAFSGDKND